MRNGRILLAAALAAGMFLVATAQAQVGPRRDGRALDANSQVGSGGINPAAARRSFNSQLYVTGQVTGLARFRGGVPYSGDNELRLDLPSSSLSTFLRQSVGLADLRAGDTYRPSPFLDPSRTILSRRDIARGLALPGTNMPRRAPMSTTALRDLVRTTTAGYKPLGGLTSLPLPASTSRVSDPRPAGSLFGLPAAQDRYRLLRQISQLDDDESALRAPDSIPDRGRVGDPAPGTEPRDLSVSATPPAPGLEAVLPEPNEDMFVDVLRSLKRKRDTEAGTPEIPEPPGSDPEKSDPPEPPRRGVTYSHHEGVVVRDLAGKGTDAFNVTLRRAQGRLRAGRFYDAAAAFRRAGALDPGNPLPHVGAGLAMFAAGEPASASARLQDALRTFPALMETRISAAEIVPRLVLLKRMRALDERLASAEAAAPNLDLLFLSTYLYWNSGQGARARQWAAKLKAHAKGNELLSAYADFILTGRRGGQSSNR